MKRNLSLIISALGTALVFFGCTKTDNSPKPYYMVASIGGVPWERDSCEFSFYIPPDTSEGILFAWAGGTPANSNYYPQVTIGFFTYHGIGTYDISAGTYVDNSSSSRDYAKSGTLTITALYPAVKGTFSFTTMSGVTVSHGVFCAERD